MTLFLLNTKVAPFLAPWFLMYFVIKISQYTRIMPFLTPFIFKYSNIMHPNLKVFKKLKRIKYDSLQVVSAHVFIFMCAHLVLCQFFSILTPFIKKII
jgi:hypothetical protein